jgi:hypothetical protein
MTKIVNECVKEYENKVRVGFVGYRGHCDGDRRITSIGLTEGKNILSKIIIYWLELSKKLKENEDIRACG